MPFWMAPVLVIGCLATYFIAGPLPPVPGLAWLTLGGWLLVQPGWVRREGAALPAGCRSRPLTGGRVRAPARVKAGVRPLSRAVSLALGGQPTSVIIQD